LVSYPFCLGFCILCAVSGYVHNTFILYNKTYKNVLFQALYVIEKGVLFQAIYPIH
jgi:hypothetical protein